MLYFSGGIGVLSLRERLILTINQNLEKSPYIGWWLSMRWGGGGKILPPRGIWQCLEMVWVITTWGGVHRHIVGRSQVCF